MAEILELAWLKKVHAPSLAVQWNGNEDLIPLSGLLYLEQQEHVVHIHLKGGAVQYVYKKLSDMAGQLTGQPFFQPHKSFLVHLAFVRNINAGLKCFVMSDGKNIPIRRELMGKARRAWEDWLFAHTRGNS